MGADASSMAAHGRELTKVKAAGHAGGKIAAT
jgi:hypothetical protein